MPNAGLVNIANAYYLAVMLFATLVTGEEISRVIKILHSCKAAGSDGIPFFVWKSLESLLVYYLQPLFLACTEFSYPYTLFRHYNTTSLRKPGKGDYSASREWWPITLLITLSIVLESVLAQLIHFLSEEYSLFLAQHIGAHCGGSIIKTFN